VFAKLLLEVTLELPVDILEFKTPPLLPAIGIVAIPSQNANTALIRILSAHFSFIVSPYYICFSSYFGPAILQQRRS
jgi:hypothetical protein